MNRNRATLAILGIFVLGVLAFSLWRPEDEAQTPKVHVIGEDYSPMQGLEKIKSDFTSESGTEVKIARFDAETLRKKYIGMFQANDDSSDVIMCQAFDVGLLGENGWVLDLGEVLNEPQYQDSKFNMDDFSDAILNLSCRYQGKLYGLPCSAQCMYLWYRKDLFSDEFEQMKFKNKYGYDLPQPSPRYSMTWNQYRDVAEFFTRSSGETVAGKKLEQDLFGTVIQGKNHIALWFEFMNFLRSFGGAYVEPDGVTVTASNSNALRALEYYLSLKKFAPPGVANYTWDEALVAFQNGQVAMMIMWSDSILAVEDPDNSRVAGLVGYSQNPVLTPNSEPVSAFGGWGFFVNAKSKHKVEAVKFIQWCNQPDVQVKWAKVGGLPANLEVYSTPEYQSVPGAAANREALTHLVGWSTEPYSERMIEVGQNELAKAVADQVSAQEALKNIATRLKQIISESNR